MLMLGVGWNAEDAARKLGLANHEMLTIVELPRGYGTKQIHVQRSLANQAPAGHEGANLTKDVKAGPRVSLYEAKKFYNVMVTDVHQDEAVRQHSIEETALIR